MEDNLVIKLPSDWSECHDLARQIRQRDDELAEAREALSELLEFIDGHGLTEQLLEEFGTDSFDKYSANNY